MRRFIQTGLGLLLTTFSVFAQGAGIEWENLNQEVMDLYHAGEYDHTVIIAKKVLEVSEKNIGLDHHDVAKSLNNLALLYNKSLFRSSPRRTSSNYLTSEPGDGGTSGLDLGSHN